MPGSIAYWGDRFDNVTAVTPGELTPRAALDVTDAEASSLPLVTGTSEPTFRTSTNELDRFRLVMLMIGIAIGIAWSRS